MPKQVVCSYFHFNCKKLFKIVIQIQTFVLKYSANAWVCSNFCVNALICLKFQCKSMNFFKMVVKTLYLVQNVTTIENIINKQKNIQKFGCKCNGLLKNLLQMQNFV